MEFLISFIVKTFLVVASMVVAFVPFMFYGLLSDDFPLTKYKFFENLYFYLGVLLYLVLCIAGIIYSFSKWNAYWL